MNYDQDYFTNGFVQYDAALELLTLIPFEASNLLDISCGSGKATALICDQRKPCRVTGIDSSPVMIKEAQRLYPLPNVTYTESSIEGPSTIDQFDELPPTHPLSDYSKAFRNIRSSLTEDRVFIVQTSCRQQWCPTINHLMDVFFDA